MVAEAVTANREAQRQDHVPYHALLGNEAGIAQPFKRIQRTRLKQLSPPTRRTLDASVAGTNARQHRHTRPRRPLPSAKTQRESKTAPHAKKKNRTAVRTATRPAAHSVDAALATTTTNACSMIWALIWLCTPKSSIVRMTLLIALARPLQGGPS